MRIWNLVTGSEEFCITGSGTRLPPLAVARIWGKECFIYPRDERILTLWDLDQREELGAWSNFEWPVRPVAATPDGHYIVAATKTGTLVVIDLSTDDLAPVEVPAHTSVINALDVTRDGGLAISGASDGTLRFWELAAAAQPSASDWHEDPVYQICLTSDGRFAISAPICRTVVSSDNTLKIWDVESATCVATCVGHSDSILSMDVASDGLHVISSSSDATIRVWSVPDGQEIGRFAGYARHIRVRPPTANRTSTFIAVEDKKITVRHTEDPWALLGDYALPSRPTAVALAVDADLLVIASADATIRVWDMRSGAIIATYATRSKDITKLAITPGGRFVLAASERYVASDDGPRPDQPRAGEDHLIRVWDLENGCELKALAGHRDGINELLITHDGRRLVSGAADRTLRIWDLDRMCELFTLRGHRRWIEAIAISCDAQVLLSGSADRMAAVWDMNSGNQITRSFIDHGVASCAISRDGRTMVIGDQAGGVHFLRLEIPARG